MNECTDPQNADKLRQTRVSSAEDDHLAREHGLVKRQVYVREIETTEERTANAVRQERHRHRRTAAGMVLAPIPKAIAEVVKSEGGFTEWLAKHMEEKAVVKRVEVTVPLTVEQRRLIGIARRVDALTGLRGWMVRKLLSMT
jgi:hypothetical protein